MADKNLLLSTYRHMVTARIMDDFVCGLGEKGRFVRHFHPGIGQEALSAGAVAGLNQDDYLFYTHRGVASLLAKGLSLKDVMYDLFMKDGGKQCGTNRGCGSKMHACKPDIGIVGRNGIFGSRYTFSAGLALASKIRNNGRISVCMYGEAEGARGQFFEAVNIAVLHNLPVVYIAEHNGFSINSKTEDIYANGSMSNLFAGFKIPIIHFDGNKVDEVIDSVGKALAIARAGKGPVVMEGFTYRMVPHSPKENPSEHLKYRTQEDLDNWKKKDPIDYAQKLLFQAGYMTPDEDAALRGRIKTEVEETFAEIEKAPEFSLDEAMANIYFRTY